MTKFIGNVFGLLEEEISLKDFFKGPRFKIILVIFFLLLGLTFAAVKSTGVYSFSNNIVNTFVAPIKRASSSIASSTTRFFEQFTKASAYYEENQELKEEIQRLKEENVELKKYKNEYDTLAEIAGMREVNISIDYLPAMVTVRDPLDQTASFSIGKGSVDGVELGDPVITSDGLIGRVDSVSTWESHVTTLYNPNLKVGVYCVESLDRGTTVGDMTISENGQCLVTGIDVDSQMKAGDTIITYGSEYYPRDLAIGTVLEVYRAEGGLSNTAVIETSSNISKVREVIVITSFEGQASPEVMRSDIQVPQPSSSVPEEVSSEEVSSAPISSTAPPVSSTPPPVSSEEPVVTSQPESREANEESSTGLLQGR